jgi:hypothetical protein
MTAPRPLATCSLMLPLPLLLLLLAARTASAMSVDSVFPSTGSMAGGTFLTIHGTGFQMPTDANLWDAQQVRALACLARERQTRAAVRQTMREASGCTPPHRLPHITSSCQPPGLYTTLSADCSNCIPCVIISHIHAHAGIGWHGHL